jgi:hypothetical protein
MPSILDDAKSGLGKAGAVNDTVGHVSKFTRSQIADPMKGQDK